MSKSAGNGVDPLLLIDKYGTDALRYTLIKEVAGAGQDIRLDYNRKTDESPSVEAARNFANKLWNAARFVMMNLDDFGLESDNRISNIHYSKLELSDRWIVSRYNQVVKQTNDFFHNYGLGEAAKGLYEFIWGDFCDWYIELVKSRLQKDANPESRHVAQQTLAYVLEGILKLLHPFMPHITEEIWHTLTQQPIDSRQSLSLQLYPEADANFIDSALEEQFELLFATIRTIRNLRAEADIKPGAKITVNLQSESTKEQQILNAGQPYIKDLAKVENLTITGEQKNTTVASKNLSINWGKIAAIIGAIFVLRVGFAVADAVDDLPFFGKFFELVGFGYSAWFVVQNILLAERRQKFWEQWFPPTPKENPPHIETQPQEPEQAIAGVVGTVQVVIPLKGVVDLDTLRAKLERSLNKAESEAQSLRGRLSNSKFVDKAPQDVVQGARDALAEAEKQAEILRDRLRGLA